MDLLDQTRKPARKYILGHLASGTGSSRADIASHGSIKCISTDDVMNVS